MIGVHCSRMMLSIFVILTIVLYVTVLSLRPHVIRYSQHIHDKLLDLYTSDPEPEFLNVQEKLIIIYTPLFGAKRWHSLQDAHVPNFLRKCHCKLRNCRISYNKNLISRADAVIFHARDMPRAFKLYEMNKYRPKNQRWVYLNSE